MHNLYKIILNIMTLNPRTTLFYLFLLYEMYHAVAYIIGLSSAIFVLEIIVLGVLSGLFLINAFAETSDKYKALTLIDKFALVFKITGALLLFAVYFGPGSEIKVLLLFAFEKSDHIPKDSQLGKHIERFPYFSIMTQIILYYIIYSSSIDLIIKTNTTVANSFIPIPPYAPILDGLKVLCFFGVRLFHYVLIVSLHRGKISKLWFLQGREKNQPFFTAKQVSALIFIFFATSWRRSIRLVGLMLSPKAVCNLYFAKVFIGSFFKYLLQPLNEEIMNLSLIHYFKAELGISGNMKELTLEQKMGIALIAGSIFTIIHFHTYSMTSFLHTSCTHLICKGMTYALITMESSNISSNVILHTFHNISCDIFDRFPYQPLSNYIPRQPLSNTLSCAIGYLSKFSWTSVFNQAQWDREAAQQTISSMAHSTLAQHGLTKQC